MHVCIFSSAFVIGGFISMNPGLFEFNINRTPASIQKTYDFSGLSGADLIQASKIRVLAGLNIVEGDGEYFLKLGHFLFKNQNEQIVKACEEFKTIELYWTAEGMASSGEPIEMQINSLCNSSEDISSTSSISLPYSKIFKESAQDGEFQFAEFPGQSWGFTNLSGEWPITWILKRVVLSGEGPRLEINSSEIVEILGTPVVLHLE